IAHVGKGAIVIVMVELCFLTFVVVRIAVRTITGAAFSAPEVGLGSPLDIISDNEIEPAIFVVVKPSCTGGPSAFIGYTGFSGNVRESSIAVVVVENRAAVAGDVQIGVTVIVVVPDGDTLAVMSGAA